MKILIAVVLSLVALQTTVYAESKESAPSAPAQAASLAGTYDVSGTNPDGTLYTGTAKITQTEDANKYKIDWIVGAAGSANTGTGTRDGNTLNATWGTDGTVKYTIGSDGNLNGTWSKKSEADKIGKETLKRR